MRRAVGQEELGSARPFDVYPLGRVYRPALKSD